LTEAGSSSSTDTVDQSHSDVSSSVTQSGCAVDFENVLPPAAQQQDLELSLANRRQRRVIRPPRRFRDVLPEPPAPLPPQPEGLDLSDGPSTIVLRIRRPRRILESSPNAFGLFRQYFAHSFPAHDPEELSTLQELWDVDATGPMVEPPTDSGLSFGPYPNLSSFALGEWYWCHGAQNSKSSFKELVKIISDPAFYPEDIRRTRWDSIDDCLGNDDSDGHGWEDVPHFADASWTRTSVTILVPFHEGTPHPGPRQFVIPDFYHRSVVSVLREKLAQPDAQHFHFEPFELRWKPDNATKSVRVYNELYTSPSFIAAHNDLQMSPPEPGCKLPRFIAGLMFASDSTELTTFGQANLWPLYLHFGNDSKYRRGKPSLHLCNHIAYFQRVRFSYHSDGN
jgi:hypothetical protein